MKDIKKMSKEEIIQEALRIAYNRKDWSERTIKEMVYIINTGREDEDHFQAAQMLVSEPTVPASAMTMMAVPN